MRNTDLKEFEPVKKKKKNLGLTIVICTVICCLVILCLLFTNTGFKSEPHEVKQRKTVVKEGPILNITDETLSLDNAITNKKEPESSEDVIEPESPSKTQFILKF